MEQRQLYPFCLFTYRVSYCFFSLSLSKHLLSPSQPTPPVLPPSTPSLPPSGALQFKSSQPLFLCGHRLSETSSSGEREGRALGCSLPSVSLCSLAHASSSTQPFFCNTSAVSSNKDNEPLHLQYVSQKQKCMQIVHECTQGILCVPLDFV